MTVRYISKTFEVIAFAFTPTLELFRNLFVVRHCFFTINPFYLAFVSISVAFLFCLIFGLSVTIQRVQGSEHLFLKRSSPAHRLQPAFFANSRRSSKLSSFKASCFSSYSRCLFSSKSKQLDIWFVSFWTFSLLSFISCFMFICSHTPFVLVQSAVIFSRFLHHLLFIYGKSS